jgi:AraC-like DNA-binding protein
MGDFASSAMVRALVQGMLSLGLHPPAFAGELTNATIPLDLKRAVVKSAIEQGGLACLPLLGRGLHSLAMEPTHLALSAGQSAGSMFVRWKRLEHYIHSQHRIRLYELGQNTALVEHIHKDNGPKPLAFEDLVVCGVLCALLEANGLTSVKARSSDIEVFPSPDSSLLSRCVELEQTGTWAISWSCSAQIGNSLDQALSWEHVSPKVWSSFACSVGNLVARHLPEILKINEAALDIGMSPRTLQRTLAAEGLSYQQLQAEVRFRLAGSLLLQQQIQIAEVGYVCGYSDQAHLTREFNKRVGLPPAKYRDLFAAK